MEEENLIWIRKVMTQQMIKKTQLLQINLHSVNLLENLILNYFCKKQIVYQGSEKWICNSSRKEEKLTDLKKISSQMMDIDLILHWQKSIGPCVQPFWKWWKSKDLKTYKFYPTRRTLMLYMKTSDQKLILMFIAK